MGGFKTKEARKPIQRVWQLDGMGMGVLEGELAAGLDMGSGLLVLIPCLVWGGS